MESTSITKNRRNTGFGCSERPSHRRVVLRKIWPACALSGAHQPYIRQDSQAGQEDGRSDKDDRLQTVGSRFRALMFGKLKDSLQY